MLAGCQVNKVVFANLIQAQTTLQNYQTQYWQVATAAHQALAALDAVQIDGRKAQTRTKQ